MITHDEHGPSAPGNVAELVTTKPDSEIAAGLKRRFEEAMVPACAILDEAIRAGLQIQFDNIGYAPPVLRHKINGLRVVKVLAS